MEKIREIKFRVWDASEKEMVDWGNVITDVDDWFRSLVLSGEPKEDILMQYTGLKDKNENEIYEGDIIKTDFGGISHVAFIEGNFCGKTKTSITGHFGFANLYSLLPVKIIGNIYENPELIEGKEVK